MSTLVDGSNLGGRLGGRRGARDAPAVVARVLAWARRRRGAVVLVFDGPPAANVADHYGRLTVRWSGSRTADDLILELAGRSPRRTRVVTDDAALAARCRILGAEVSPTTEILSVRPEGETERPQGPVDVADWEAWFASRRPDPDGEE